MREGAPGIGTAGDRDQPSESGRPTGVEIASTAVKAAGEVAQFGFTLGGKVLKRVVDRLPRRCVSAPIGARAAFTPRAC